MKCYYITHNEMIKGLPIIKEPIPYLPVGESDNMDESVFFNTGKFNVNEIAIVNEAEFDPENHQLAIEEIGYYTEETKMEMRCGRPVPNFIYQKESENKSESALILLDIPEKFSISKADNNVIKNELLDKEILPTLNWLKPEKSLQIWIIGTGTKKNESNNYQTYQTYLMLVKKNTLLNFKKSQYIFWDGKYLHITYK